MPVTENTPRHLRGRTAQLPQRTRQLRSRGERMCRNGWDINALWLLAADSAALARASEALGDLDGAGRLDGLAEHLQAFLDPPALPDDDAASTIAALLGTLVADVDAADTLEEEIETDATLFGYAANEENGFPLLVRPPARYWQRAGKPSTIITETAHAPAQMRVDDGAAQPERAPAPAAPIAPVAAHAPPASTEPSGTGVAPDPAVAVSDPESVDESALRRLAIHLGDASDLSSEIDVGLRAAGYELHRAANLETLKDSLTRMPPHLVVLGSAHLMGIEEVGALVLAARARANRRVDFIALSDEADLGSRLRAMRAGCDAFMVQPVNAGDLVARATELADSGNAAPYRILIVEDDRSQALFAESILRRSGMQTLTIGEASAVLGSLDDFQPDLILMDLHMPECDGMELTALIREREAYISTPIVFLSGESDTEKHFEALDAGGDDFLSKPIAPKHLIAAVTSRVRRARKVERRRTTPVEHEPVKGVHDVVALSRRLSGMLAMDDATTRDGGLMFVQIADVGNLQARLRASEFRAVLDRVGGLLAANLGANDMLARCGEGGFLLLNPDREAAALESGAINLRDRVARETPDGSGPGVGIVIGICPFSAAVGDAKAMIDAAERAMLEARAAHRNGVFTTALEDASAVSESLVEAIRDALESSAFRIVFQPIVSLHGEADEQFQALLRLPLADGRVCAASELVPAAEQAGLIAQVDRWMLDNCLAAIGERFREGRTLRLFVSQSLQSMRDPGRVDWLREALDTHRVPPSQLSIEIRAADVADALADIGAFASAIRLLGVSLTLSGFEAGAGLNEMLGALPVDFIKLSPRYARMQDEAVRAELRQLVIDAHANDRRVIAPRVEEARVAATLWSTGVDLIQGNFVQQAARDLSYDFHGSSL